MKKLAISLFTLLLLVLALEVGSTVYVSRFASQETVAKFGTLDQIRSRQDQRFVRHYYLGYLPSAEYQAENDRHSTLGFRGPELRENVDRRIACVGASTTYGIDMPSYRDAYPALLEEALQEEGRSLEVVNAGVPGWTTWESLSSFQFRVLDLDVDLVVVYHGLNDIHPRLTWPPEAYRGDASAYRSPPQSILWHGALEHSTLYRILMVKAGRLESQADLDRAFGGSQETFYGRKFRRQRIGGTYPTGIFAEVSAERMLEVNTPRYFERNLQLLCAAAKARGVKVLLVTFASSPAAERNPFASSPEYVAALSEMNAVTARVAATEEVALFDLAASFPAEAAYFTDGIHMNAEGQRLRAQAVAQAIREQGLLD